MPSLVISSMRAAKTPASTVSDIVNCRLTFLASVNSRTDLAGLTPGKRATTVRADPSSISVLPGSMTSSVTGVAGASVLLSARSTIEDGFKRSRPYRLAAITLETINTNDRKLSIVQAAI